MTGAEFLVQPHEIAPNAQRLLVIDVGLEVSGASRWENRSRCLNENLGKRANDIGVALRDGGFEAVYADRSERGEQEELQISEEQTALIFFVTRLLHRLQQMASGPAIDYRLYGSATPGAPRSRLSMSS